MGNGNAKNMALIRSERFVSTKLSDMKEANHNPIYGYQHLPILALEKAVEPLVQMVPGLMTYVGQAKDNCNQNSVLLTHDESASVYLYSMPVPFFSLLNAALRAKNRDALKPWFGFLKLFLGALEKLPSLDTVVWRGVAGDVGSDVVDGRVETWWSVNSCSTALDVVQLYLGKTGTVFAINSINGKDISAYSVFEEEKEVVLLPGTPLFTKSKPLNFEERLFIVHFEEKGNKSKGASADNRVQASDQNRSSKSTANASSTYPRNQKEAESPLQRSLDLSSIQRKPLKSQSLRKIMGYSDPKITCSNDEHLLIYEGDHLHLLDENLKIISSIKNTVISSIEMLDISWCALVHRFIVITKTNMYVFDPITYNLSCVESVRLQQNEKQFISCTCWNEALFIAVADSYYPFYVDHYNLPDFVFTRQYTVTDLIGQDLPPELNWGQIKSVTAPKKDERKICIIRSNRERLGLVMNIQYKSFFYVVNLAKRPFGSVKMMLTSTDCKLSTIAPSGEWLLLIDSYNKKIMQVSLDCELTTEYEASREGHRDEVSSVLFLRSSRIVVLRGTDLELCQV